MKAFVIASDFPPPFVGGSVVYVHSLLAGFSESATVLTSPLPPGEVEPTPAPHCAERSRWLVPSRAPSSLSLIAMYAYLPMKLIVRRSQIKDDFVLLSLGVVGNAILVPVCRLLGLRPIIFAYAEELTMPLYGSGLKTIFKRILLKRLYRWASGFVAVSQFTKATLQSIGADPKNITVIWPPINSEKIHRDIPISPPGNRILSVGRMVRRKGFDKLILAIDRLRTNIPDVSLWIVGDGSERPFLESLITKLNLQDRVVLKGEASDEELAALYRKCDVFALANTILENGDCEGSPTVLIEASSYAKPVIAGDGTGADAMVKHGETGYLINTASIEDLSNRLYELLRNPELSAKFGKAGRLKAEKYHTSHYAGSQLHEFLQSLLGKTR